MQKLDVASGRVRWAVLLSALIGTLAAIVYEPEEAPARLLTARAAVPALQRAADRMPAPFEEEAAGNPFGQQEWPAAPVEAPPAPPAPAAVVDPAPPPAPVTPPLPFRYVGRFSDENGGVTYLARGEQTLIVRPGDVLDQAYKVVAVDNTKIEFEYVETGQHQSLPIPQWE